MKLSEFLAENKAKMNDIENEFVETVYYPYAGENGLDYLKVQTPFEDSFFKKRKLDFTVQTEKYKYVIEIDGYTYHAEGAVCVSPEYFDDLLVKQNDLILNGWKLLRFSYNQIRQDQGLCIDTLRRSFKSDPLINPIFGGKQNVEPTYPQAKALERTHYYREQGKTKGLVVLPTGIGKTFFSAFDAKRFNGRTLFVVHRDTILTQAYDSYGIVWDNATRGYFNAETKDTTSQVIFASKDTLYRDENIKLFSPTDFDYIVIDEVHHLAGSTYQKIIDYFNPRFLLGMTATPERQDKVNILEYFDYNLFYEMDQKEAIESGYLTGFVYYGLKDDIDYSKIKHNGRRYDPTDLGRKLNIEKRNKAILEKYLEICPKAKSIGFCVTIQHAIDMAKYFNDHGIPAQAIHSDNKTLSLAQREAYIQDFRDNQLQVLFTVDVFNEGVDFPDVEALLFLRPTESKTIFTQQLGRGLRLNPYKEHVIVLDFIGNFKNAERIKQYLKTGNSGNKQGNSQGNQNGRRKFLDKEYLDWALGCEVHFDQSVQEMFSKMEEQNREISNDELIDNYFEVKEKIKRKPSKDDINNLAISKFKLSTYNNRFKSWSEFLGLIGEATKASYHYPQGTHLGHIFYTIKSLGDKNLCERLKVDTYSPPKGISISTLGRKTRYNIWACMELGLIVDDRKVEDKEDKSVYQNLTKKGEVLYKILKKYASDPSFFEFKDSSKVKVSWEMIHKEQYFNDFIKNLPLSEKEELMSIFFNMDAVQHLCKYLFHENQNKQDFIRREVYDGYFDTPFIKEYFEINGIKQDSDRGAERRLPFIINILESFEVVKFVNRSMFKVVKLPKVSFLYSNKVENQARNKEAVEKYYSSSGRILPESITLTELRSLFGKDFLTDNYFVKNY